MSTEDYIASGILESYVLDQLSADERQEVEQRMLSDDKITEEIKLIEQSIEALAISSSIEVPTNIREKLVGVETPTIPIHQTATPSYLKFAVAASVLIALTTSFLAFNYWSKWQSSESRLADLIAQNNRISENYNTVNQQLEDFQNSVAIMNNSNFAQVLMNGTDNAPSSIATVYWNRNSQEVFLGGIQLDELPEDKQYQLWAIIDGKPVDAGVFDPTNSGLLVKMKEISNGVAAFAVTIEPKGGSENPSLETMQVIGNV